MYKMGNYATTFDDNQGHTVSDTSHPSKDNWITEHATAVGCKFHSVTVTDTLFKWDWARFFAVRVFEAAIKTFFWHLNFQMSDVSLC